MMKKHTNNKSHSRSRSRENPIPVVEQKETEEIDAMYLNAIDSRNNSPTRNKSLYQPTESSIKKYRDRYDDAGDENDVKVILEREAFETFRDSMLCSVELSSKANTNA